MKKSWILIAALAGVLLNGFIYSVYSEQVDLEGEIDSLLARRDYPELERILMSFLQAKGPEISAVALTTAYDYIAQKTDLLPIFDDWCASSAESHIPFMVRGMFYAHYAWEARGSGYAVTVTDEGRRRFKVRLQKAKEDLEKARDMDPTDPNPPAALIIVAMAGGLGDEYMEARFQEAIQADPNCVAAYQRKLTYLMPKWAGSKEKVDKFVDEIKNAFPIGSRIRLLASTTAYTDMHYGEELRRVLQRPKVWQEIKAEIEGYLERHPDDVFARQTFADFSFMSGEFESAEQQYEEVDNVLDEAGVERGMYARFYKSIRKALALIEAGEPEEAHKFLLENVTDYYTDLGLITGLPVVVEFYRRQEDLSQAEKLLQQLLSSDQTAVYVIPYSHLFYGFVYEKAGQLREAFEEYSAAVQADPNYINARIKLGHIYELGQRYEDAAREYHAAVELDPMSPSGYFDLGRIYEDVFDRHTEAIPFLLQGLELTPYDNLRAEYYYLIGKTYENIDDHNNAKVYFRKYLELEPQGKYYNAARRYSGDTAPLYIPPAFGVILLLLAAGYFILRKTVFRGGR